MFKSIIYPIVFFIYIAVLQFLTFVYYLVFNSLYYLLQLTILLVYNLQYYLVFTFNSAFCFLLLPLSVKSTGLKGIPEIKNLINKKSHCVNGYNFRINLIFQYNQSDYNSGPDTVAETAFTNNTYEEYFILEFV